MFFFLFRTTLLRWLTFLLASLNVTLTVSALLDLSISSDASICFKVAFPHFGNSDHVAVLVSVDISFKLNLIRVPLFITQLISYQVKPHSSPWFSTAGAAAIARKSHFRLYQQNKSSTSKVKFCQNNKSSASKVNFSKASNCCKRVLEAAKLAHANKTKQSIYRFPETWLSQLQVNC